MASGVDTPVYRVRLNGFDTHANQTGRHASLLGVLAKGLSDFSNTMRSMGEWDQIIVMTYSEFGRRAAENRSSGTDHGTAAPHMVIGGAVNGGIFGEAPDLSNLIEGDPKYTMDYRALYKNLLVAGLGVEESLPHLARFEDERLKALLSHA